MELFEILITLAGAVCIYTCTMQELVRLYHRQDEH